MNEIQELGLAKKAMSAGLVTFFQLKSAVRMYARDRVQQGPGARSLRDILVQAGCLREEDWDRLAATPTPGRSFGGFRIGSELGRGGMGVVYQAFDTRHQRSVALKLLNARIDGMNREETEQRFLQEGRLLSILPRHPGIVAVHEAGVIEGQRFISMEPVDGIPLSMWQKSAPALSLQLRVLCNVALAVHHAHSHGIVHRDLKPGNILIRRDDTPVVMDFGLATPEQRNLRLSLTPRGIAVGSPGYMSPEQARGLRTVDRTTDVYSLGVILYQMVTDRMPFEGGSPIEVLVKTVKNAVTRPSTHMKNGLNPVLLKTLDAICMKALAATPKDRHLTARAFAEDLSRSMGHSVFSETNSTAGGLYPR